MMQRISSIVGNGAHPAAEETNSAERDDGRSKRLRVVTRQRVEFHDLTSHIEAAVRASGIRSGTVTVRSMHTTVAVFLNEWQQALLEDCRQLIESLVPDGRDWRHNDPRYSDCERGNAAAHLRALLLGSSVPLAVRDGQIERGTWQSIIFAEFDGPQNRSVAVDIHGHRWEETRDV